MKRNREKTVEHFLRELNLHKRELTGCGEENKKKKYEGSNNLLHILNLFTVSFIYDSQFMNVSWRDIANVSVCTLNCMNTLQSFFRYIFSLSLSFSR